MFDPVHRSTSPSTKPPTWDLGGATYGLLPRASHMLEQQCYRDALLYLTSKKRKAHFKSLMDFLFVAYFAGYTEALEEVYAGKLDQIEDCEETLEYFDERLCEILEAALDCYAGQERISWANFRASQLEKVKKKLDAELSVRA